MLQAKKGKGSKTRLPITPPIMQVLIGSVAHWYMCTNINACDAAMLWAARSLCFFGFFRSGELTALSESQYDLSENLSFRNITFDDREHPSILRVNLNVSKTDLFRLRVDIFIGKKGNGNGSLFIYAW